MANIDNEGSLDEERLERMRQEFRDAQHRRRQLSASTTSRRETDTVPPVDAAPIASAATVARETDARCP